MSDQRNGRLCSEDDIAGLVKTLSDDEPTGLRELDRLLEAHPDDARLYFLQGSFMAAGRNYVSAVAAMRRAVALAPDYAIARFQLGFLLLTSGEPHAAQEAWGPLHGLPQGSYLRIFVNGLTHLIHDRFAEAVEALEKGIAVNVENPALNGDMQLIIDEARIKIAEGDSDGPQSSAQFLLQQAALKDTRH